MPDITVSANVHSFMQAADYAAMKTLLTLNNVENTAISTWSGSINLTTLGTIATGTWQGGVIAGAYGGTGVANTGKTITLGGSWTHTGAHTVGITTTANTSVTFPTSGTLIADGGNVSSINVTTANVATFNIKDTGGDHTLQVKVNEDLTANRILNLVLNDANRALTLTGDLAMSGAYNATFTFTANTGVTFPTTGTLSTLAGAEALSGKKIQLSGSLGTDDTWEGVSITGKTAGATIAQWEAVYLDSSSTWQLADANGTGTYPARGLAVASYSSTNAAEVLVQGIARNDSWAWTPGGAIYLSGTAGGLTQTAPSTSGDKVQVVGYALDADRAYFNFTGEYLTLT